MIKLSKVYTELSTGMHKAVQVNACFHFFEKEGAYDRFPGRSV